MKIPQGLYRYESSQCCKLKKSFYGLKQASRKWYEKLSNLLLSSGYSQSHVDHNLFIKHEKGEFTGLLIYVDDIVLTSNSPTEIRKLKHMLQSNF
uniref:Copia protein n=1 Tax=Cajanus cajan TaxID=3821 RepID=A0A151TEK8_CAJCA|nr:Copia protein [Cajanus cajan]